MGQSLDPSGVIDGVQIAEHRLLFPIDIHLTNSKLRHQIAYSKHKDDTIMSNGGITLIDFINQCKTKNVIPIVNLNFFVDYRKSNWTSQIPPEQYGRCSRIVADLLTENFNLAVIAPLNEPKKWLDDNATGIYTKSAYNALNPSQHKKIKFSIGNEEYFCSLFEYLGNLFRGKSNVMFGAHLLSSMGNWDNPKKYFNRILDWKNLANSYGLEILNIEGGSWFEPYCTYEGHNINKDIIRISKQCGYWASNIVCIDNNNIPKYRRLGYRKYNSEYTQIISEPMMNESTSYFQDFINFVKKEGKKYIPEPIIEEENMKLEKYYYRLKNPKTYNRDKTKAGIKFIQTVIEVEPDGKWGDATDNALETYQITNGLVPDKIVGPLTFREMMKTDPNAYIDLQYFLAIGEW